MIYSEKKRQAAAGNSSSAETVQPAAVPPSAQPDPSDENSSSFSQAGMRRPAPRKKIRLTKPWGYVGLFILFSLPVIGFIFLIVFCFSDKNRNRKNFARGYFLYALVCVILLSGLLGAGYFTLIKPQADALGGGPQAVLTVLKRSVSGDAVVLDAAQQQAIASGDLSALDPEQLQELEALFAGADDEFLRRYIDEEPKQESTSRIVTELPDSLPDTFSGRSISTFQTGEGETCYSIFNVSTDEFESFSTALGESFTLQSEAENSLRFLAQDGSTLMLNYSNPDELLTLIVF